MSRFTGVRWTGSQEDGEQGFTEPEATAVSTEVHLGIGGCPEDGFRLGNGARILLISGVCETRQDGGWDWLTTEIINKARFRERIGRNWWLTR